ncbi:DUF4097 family beta strand repeat-containing protein [Streptomyces monomycini]|uniref:DUF4097 family beta strand repeat-containing protein n=1 Tax=Streptomyces monomycini TaxID=371720 RepID=UPI0004AA0B4C|nr:DUF4097 family beta strand repeat-containing protein [Streptomyces monomycini]
MPVRTLTAQQPGPVLIDIELLGAGSTVTVRTDATRTDAEVTIRTADESGVSADAVRDAELRWDARGALVAHVQGTGGISGGTTIVNSGGGAFTVGSHFGVVQHVQNNVGSIVMVSGGDLNLGGGRYQFHGTGTVHVVQGASPVEISAVVPEGCSVTARTQSAGVTTDGTFTAVSAATQSGDVRVPGHSERVTANTQSGDIDVHSAPHIIAKTQSGDIRLGRTDVTEASTLARKTGKGAFWDLADHGINGTFHLDGAWHHGWETLAALIATTKATSR